MRYVFFNTGSWQGNASMMRFRELGREFVARGIEVFYAVDDLPYNREKLDVDPKATVVYTSIRGKISQHWKRRKTIANLKPDFVHVLNPAAKSCMALWGSKWRVVGDWDEWPVTRPYGFPRRTMEKFLDHWLRHRATVISVCSRYLHEQFRTRFGLSPHYIPYAAYLPEQPPTTSPYAQRTAVYMGNLYPAYDQDIVFEAAALLKARGQEPHITFVGKGPELEKWSDFVKERSLSNVNVVGFVSDGVQFWRYLRHAHVMLFPIRVTPINLARCPAKTFAYAQACRPIIANKVGEVAEVLGDKATYIEPTPEAFADAIQNAMERDLPDVDYGIEAHNWSVRADALLAALPK